MAILCLEDSFVVAHFRLTFQNLSEHFDRHGGIKRHERGKGGRGTQVSFLFFFNFFLFSFLFHFWVCRSLRGLLDFFFKLCRGDVVWFSITKTRKISSLFLVLLQFEKKDFPFFFP